MEHLKTLDLHLARQPLLSLKGIQLTPNDCEPLEEIFMRVSGEICGLKCNCLMFNVLLRLAPADTVQGHRFVGVPAERELPERTLPDD